jgi:hypothetical protein
MWGTQDEILDPKYVDEFERDLDLVETLLLDDCGHVAHLEQSERCAAAILTFAHAADGSSPVPKPGLQRHQGGGSGSHVLRVRLPT